MAKIIIKRTSMNNSKNSRQNTGKSADNHLDEIVIRDRLSLHLASALSSLAQVQVNLQAESAALNQPIHYRCELAGICANSRRFITSSEHPDALQAVDGAARRLRRSIVRNRRLG